MPRPTSIRQEVTNLPNLLTFGRILAIPPVMLFMLQNTPESNFWATALFSLAAITDWLDGYLARRRNLVSLLGKLLDPMADKLIVLAVLVTAVQLTDATGQSHVPGWFVVVLLSREIAVSGLRAMAATEGLEIAVVRAGKWKTALQLCGLVGIIIHYPYPVDFVFATVDVDFGALGLALLGLSMVFSLVSAGMYFSRFLRAVVAPRETDHAS